MDANRTLNSNNDSRSVLLINVVSVVVPIVVVILLSIQNKFNFGGWTGQLPHVIGAVNTVASVSLLFGFIAIKMGKIDIHRFLMSFTFLLGGIFLVCYVIYHMTNPPKRFEGDGAIKTFYLITLFSHIGLSLVVLPLVLRAMLWGYLGRIDRHRRIARYAFPIWLYVSVTGVIVYLMAHHLAP
jgi:putative membrane protein